MTPTLLSPLSVLSQFSLSALLRYLSVSSLSFSFRFVLVSCVSVCVRVGVGVYVGISVCFPSFAGVRVTLSGGVSRCGGEALRWSCATGAPHRPLRGDECNRRCAPCGHLPGEPPRLSPTLSRALRDPVAVGRLFRFVFVARLLWLHLFVAPCPPSLIYRGRWAPLVFVRLQPCRSAGLSRTQRPVAPAVSPSLVCPSRVSCVSLCSVFPWFASLVVCCFGW